MNISHSIEFISVFQHDTQMSHASPCPEAGNTYMRLKGSSEVRNHLLAFVMKEILYVLVILANLCERYVIAEHEEDASTDLFVIEGKVFPWDNAASTGWQLMTHVMANGGEHYGFLRQLHVIHIATNLCATTHYILNEFAFYFREDGTFIISNVPSGSYMVEVVNPNYVYEPVRVEINSKGKFRARKVNLIQTSQVIQVPYPLKMRPLAPFRYFQVREQWRLTDFLFNPMVTELFMMRRQCICFNLLPSL